MQHEQRLADAITSNAITSILLIDDAYDPPDLDENTLAALADSLDSDANRAVCAERNIKQDAFDGAITAALDGDPDNEELQSVHRALYSAFALTGEGFDPGGRFEQLKAALWKHCALSVLSCISARTAFTSAVLV